ncbi:hypothetical protein PUN28_006109 [Cardiocondyla obscurior]
MIEENCESEIYGETDYGISNNVTEERAMYIRTFIQIVYANAELYIKKCKGYSKNHDKSLTWACIGKRMTPALTGLEAEKLFHRLREKFGKERKKIRMSLPKSGAGTETSTYQSNWIFYNDLLFLTDHIIARHTTSNFQRCAVRSHSITVQSQSPIVQDGLEYKNLATSSLNKSNSSVSSSTIPLNKQSQLSPVELNLDHNLYCFSPTSSIDVEITNTDGTSTSCKSEGEQYTSEESKGSSPAIWKTMAASIKPTKTVPLTDPIKKRKRDSEKTSDMLSHSSKNVSLLAASLSSALERFGQSQPLQPAPRPNIYSDVETMLGPIAVALSKVDEKEQVSCVMDMLAVVKRYIK